MSKSEEKSSALGGDHLRNLFFLSAMCFSIVSLLKDACVLKLEFGTVNTRFKRPPFQYHICSDITMSRMFGPNLYWAAAMSQKSRMRISDIFSPAFSCFSSFLMHAVPSKES